MQFTATGHDDGSKMTKLAAVGLIHVVLGYGLIHSINSAHVPMSKLMETVVEMIPVKVEPPPPPPEPPKPSPKVAAPKAVVPPPEVDVPPPQQPEPTIQAEVQAEPAPAPENVGTPAPASDSGPTGAMRSAVFAEGCATPEYPTRALRNGDAGTTSLALLVGPDGRVQNARVTHSSGSRDLDKAAQAALSMCKFKPATEGGQAQAGWASIDYVWKLDS